MINIQELLETPIAEGPLSLEETKVLIGANYFSGGPVVRLRINLGQFDEVFTNLIPGFYEKLQTVMPTLYDHHCSVGKPGGFFERVKEGTLLGHVMEHMAIELQTLAGMDVGFGKTRETKEKGVFNVVIRFFDEMAAIYAGRQALSVLNLLLTEKDADIAPIISNLIEIREKRLLGFSTQKIVYEAENRKIPAFRLDKYNLVQLGTGCHRRIIRATITDRTSLIGVETTDDKYLTNQILNEAGVPVPYRIITESAEQAIAFFREVKMPVVVKPATGYQGKRVNVHLDSEEKVLSAFQWTKSFEEEVIIQEFIPGNTFRVLVIDGKFVAAVQLIAPMIVGDGAKTVAALIESLNKEEGRELGDKGKLSKVEIDEDTLKILEIKGFGLDTVVPSGKKLFLKNSGNMKLGASSVDVTDNVGDYNRFTCERISKILNLDVAGIDIISEDIRQPLHENNGRVIEVNAAPDFRMHINPTVGRPVEVHRNFIDMLFPKDKPSRVPVISITGTRGKSILSGLLDHAYSQAGHITGVMNSKGMSVGGRALRSLDHTDSSNALTILKDPTITVAILETPVETVLKHGLGYSFADIGVVLNLHESEHYYHFDHIRDLEDVSYAKSVVAEEVHPDGCAVLNVSNPMILEMQERLYSKSALFAAEPGNPAIATQILKGGLCGYSDGQQFFIHAGTENHRVCSFDEISWLVRQEDRLTATEVLMAGALVMFVNGWNLDSISDFLKKYEPAGE